MNQFKVNIASYSMACIGQNLDVLKLIGFDSCLNFADHNKKLLSHVPAIQKRRLDRLGKSVLTVYYACCDAVNQPLVFSSNHGNIHLTYTLLKSMIENDEMSPTSFSLSVHNAIAGIISIIDHNKNDIVAIAPGNNGILPAFIEAASLFHRVNTTTEVGVIFYDTILPEFYQQHAEHYPEYSIVAACKLVADNSTAKKLTVQFERKQKAPKFKSYEQHLQLEPFFELLETKHHCNLFSFNSIWQCSIR